MRWIMTNSLLTTSILALVVSVTAGTAAHAATLNDPAIYKDLSSGVAHSLNDFAVSDLDNGPSTLSLRYGRWNGDGNAIFDFAPTFNGVKLATVQINNDYNSTPTSYQWDVSSLITSGVNTLSVLGVNQNNGDNMTTFAVGDATLEYQTVAAVPLPASLPLILVGIAGLGLATRKRA